MLSKDEFRKLCEDVFSFHTKRAPGLAIGVAMVDYAREALGPIKGKMNAISETQACLSDVIQVMTGCTIGNRYLRVLKNLGRYALTLFDREDGHGVRVSCNVSRIDQQATPELYNFFHRSRGEDAQSGGPARELSGQQIIQEFETVGRSLFDVQRVTVINHGKPAMLPAKICKECGESFLSRDEKHVLCDFCSGIEAYFQEHPNH